MVNDPGEDGRTTKVTVAVAPTSKLPKSASTLLLPSRWRFRLAVTWLTLAEMKATALGSASLRMATPVAGRGPLLVIVTTKVRSWPAVATAGWAVKLTSKSVRETLSLPMASGRNAANQR